MSVLDWETKNVLAKNLRPGDRLQFLNRKTMRAVVHPIKSVAVEGKYVGVTFGGYLTGCATSFKARESVLIKRKKPSLDAARRKRGES